MNIMIAGAGGVGGYIAGKLARLFPDITVLARGAALAAMRERGLTIIDGSETFTVHPQVTDTPAGIMDAIFFCTKAYGLDAVMDQVRPCVGEHTLLLPLLNGVNVYRQIEQKLQAGIALSGSIYIYSQIREPGVIEKTGPLLRVVMGVPNKPAAESPQSLLELCGMLNECGIPTEIPDDIIMENWVKWSLLNSNGQANAYFDLPAGAVREDPEKMSFTVGLLREVLLVAKAEGVKLPAGIEQTHIDTIMRLPYQSESSLCRDIRTPGKPTELAMFAGELCRMADVHGLDVPCNRSMLNRFKDRL